MKTTTYQTPPQRPCHATLRTFSPALHDRNSDFVGGLISDDGDGCRVGVLICRREEKRFRLLVHSPRLAGRSPKVYYSSLWDISLSDRNPGGAR